MNTTEGSITIPRLDANAPEPLSFAGLRNAGIQHVMAMGSEAWTDYNSHDPGITLLEALCYAITDLDYRTSFPTADLLAPPPGQTFDAARQGFFTPNRIMTVNPWTVADYRRLLAMVPGVKNAWLFDSKDGHLLPVVANQASNTLEYGKSANDSNRVVLRGFYDVLLDFEDDPAGDLNSGKVSSAIIFQRKTDFIDVAATIEARLPSWHDLNENACVEPYSTILALATHDIVVGIDKISVTSIKASKDDKNGLKQDDPGLAKALRNAVYVTLGVTCTGPQNTAVEITLTDIPVSVWFKSEEDRKAMGLADIEKALGDAGASGILARYLALIRAANGVVRRVRGILHRHRNLCEDFGAIDAVQSFDVGVCLDLLLGPEANPSEIMARVLHAIEGCFAPALRWYSLGERLALGKTTDEIFNGPMAAHDSDQRNSFLDDDELADSNLPRRIHASDVINLLMDIDGVIGVENFAFLAYSKDGARTKAEPWSIDIPERHEVRLHRRGSKILCIRNGLPFLADPEESAGAELALLAEGHSRLTHKDAIDLTVPEGRWRDIEDHEPVQHALPSVYGVGPSGLPQSADALRKVQALQLKGYLFPFEILVTNYLSQLRNLPELFAIDKDVQRTYFTAMMDSPAIKDMPPELRSETLSDKALAEPAESSAQRLSRRNRFLDHLLARFGEQFSDHALLRYRHGDGRAVSQEELIQAKVDFLKHCADLGKDRARSINLASGDAPGESGLGQRIRNLLNMGADETLVVVEHHLLRPRAKGHPLLPVCIQPGCESCHDRDPYSFRLTVVMDGDASKPGGNLAYRRFAEDTIRMEAPAHVSVKVCWVSREQATDFTEAWAGYISALRSDANIDSTLATLLTEFCGLNNQYPQASLHDCRLDSEGNPVFLDHTAI